MDKLKKINIKLIIIVLAIVLISLVFFLKNKLSNKQVDMGEPDEIAFPDEDTELYNIEKEIKRVSIRNNYYLVESCLQKFYSMLTINNINNNDIDITKENVYSMLDSNFISEKNITLDNVLDYFQKNNNATYTVVDMFVTQRSYDISVYFVYGKIRENGNIDDFSCMIAVDRTNDTFKYYPTECMQDLDITIGNNIDIDVPNSIENGAYNTFEFKNISNDYHAEELFYQIKNLLLYDNETLWERLNDDFKSKFNDYQDFYDYISANYKKFIKLNYGGYNKLNENNMDVTYILSDDSGEFKFKLFETDPFYYNLIIE